MATSGKSGGVYALRADNGRILWKSHTPGGPVSVGIGKDQKPLVLVAGEDGQIYGVDAISGQTAFTIPTEIVPSVAPVTTDLTGDHIPDILVVSATAGVGAYDGKNYQSLWVYSSPNGFLSAPLVQDFTGAGKKEVLLTDRSGKVSVLDGATGNEIWSASTGNASIGAGLLWKSPSGPLVIIGSRDQWIYAFRARSGDLVWRYYARHPVSSRLLLAKSSIGADLACFCTEGQGIQALHLQYQFLQWRYDFRGKCVGDPILANVFGDEEPEVIIVSDQRIVHTLTGGQGSVRFLDMLELPATPTASPGLLYRGPDLPAVLAVSVTGLRLPKTGITSATVLGYSFHPLAPPLVPYPIAGLTSE